MNDQPLFGDAPQWNSALGYLFLLDGLIRYACGYLINKQWEEYYLTLEAWYLETVHRFENNKRIVGDNKYSLLKELNNARMGAKNLGTNTSAERLKLYHQLLNKCTHLDGLRMKDKTSLPAILGQT